MLKISIVEGPNRRWVVVEGKPVAPRAAEMKTVCGTSRADLKGRELVIQMKNLTVISQEGENLLLK